MSEAIARMLRDREIAADAAQAGLARELNRRIVEVQKAKFVAAFNRQARYHRRNTHTILPPMPIETLAVCEGADLAADPGWDAERAWRYSETRQRAINEVEAELERRRG